MVNKYSVRWSRQSKIDLKQIFDYILATSKSKERAIYVITGIKQRANETTLFPAKHAKEPTLRNMRYAVKWSYKILFTIDEKHVNIVRIFHTAQNPEKLIQ